MIMRPRLMPGHHTFSSYAASAELREGATGGNQRNDDADPDDIQDWQAPAVVIGHAFKWRISEPPLGAAISCERHHDARDVRQWQVDKVEEQQCPAERS